VTVAEPEPLQHSITPLIWACALGGRIFARGMTRVAITGAIDAIPADGPLILASNHASNLDVPIVGSWLIPAMGRRIHWLGKKELFDWPIVGWLAANGGVHPVDRSKADVEAYRLASRILADGGALFVFPEGTRSPTGSLQAARDGVALLALRSGAPIVPIGIAGSHHVWPKGQRFPHPGGRVTAQIGEAFTLGDLVPADTDKRALKTVATTILMHRIADLLPPDQRGVYAETGPS
jgi:1-acyl-sn-glycerol-3-phosphate acyltransferase